MQPLLEAGNKVNLDDFPCKTEEHVLGVDKPVEDTIFWEEAQINLALMREPE